MSGAANQPAVIRDFADIWRAAEKTVFSRTLQTVASARTHIERTFDPDAVRRVKEAAGADTTIGDAEPAGQAVAAGLVDESHLFLGPIIVGGGKRALPDDSASRSRSWTSAGSETASFTSTTALAADRDDNPA